jgi:hypothetical protein
MPSVTEIYTALWRRAAFKGLGRTETRLHGSSRVSAISTFVANGARPQYKPNAAGGTGIGTRVAYDYQVPASNFRAVRIVDQVDGVSNPVELTLGAAGLPQRHSGAAVWHPTANYLVFQSEADPHYLSTVPAYDYLGNPGLGFHCDLWSSAAGGAALTNLTNYTHAQTALDTVKMALFPRFNPAGDRLIWTELFGNYPLGSTVETRTTAWGSWRLMIGNFSLPAGIPTLANIRQLLHAPNMGGNYVVPMGMFSASDLLVAGNFEGQHEYRMDLCRVNLAAPVGDPADGVYEYENLTNDRFWTEGSTVTPAGRVVSMTGRWSRFEMPEDQLSQWDTYVRESDLSLQDGTGEFANGERLTYFNDPLAPEFDAPNGRTTVAVMDVKPDGLEILVSYRTDSGPWWTPVHSEVGIRRITLTGAI